MSCQPCYVPSCSPSCVSYPVGGLGSLCSPCGGLSGGLSSYGGGVPSTSLGIAPGANVSCIGQTPPSEMLIQPPPVCVMIPGPILASTCEPLKVGGYTACGGSGSSSSGSSYGRLGLCQPRGIAKVCGSPC